MRKIRYIKDISGGFVAIYNEGNEMIIGEGKTKTEALRHLKVMVKKVKALKNEKDYLH